MDEDLLPLFDIAGGVDLDHFVLLVQEIFRIVIFPVIIERAVAKQQDGPSLAVSKEVIAHAGVVPIDIGMVLQERALFDDLAFAYILACENTEPVDRAQPEFCFLDQFHGR